MTDEQPKPFGLTTLTCVVIAGMIGAGVFTTSGYTLLELKTPFLVLVAWMIGGAIAVCGSAAYGALAQQMPESGGEYLYLHRRIHPFAGFLTGWVSLTAGFSGAIAFAAVTFEKYVLPDSPMAYGLPEHSLALLVILICGLGHSFLIRGAAVLQNTVVFVKVAILLSFLGLAAWSQSTHIWHWEPLVIPPDPAGPGSGETNLWYAMATSVMWISLSYAGFNAAVYVASEVNDPVRVIPRAMLLGTVLTTILYVLLNLVFVTAAPAAQLAGQDDIAAISARMLGGPVAERLIRAAIALATLSSVASMIMTGPRIYSRMADDGLFPRFFRTEKQTIHRTVLLQTGLAMILVMTSTLQKLLSYLGTTLSISSAITVSTLLFVHSVVPVGLFRKLAALIYVGATLISVVLMSVNDIRRLYGTILTIVAGSLLWLLTRNPAKPNGGESRPVD